MFSVKGVYEKGSIQLLQPVELTEDATVIITFLDDDFPFEGDETSPDNSSEVEQEEKSDEYYEKIRKHKRYKAKGFINLLEMDGEKSYPLNDYSAGGLSFFSDKTYQANAKITASLKYVASGEVLEMKFDIEVKRVFDGESEGQYKVGCQFPDQVDEELWHMIMD